MYESTPNFAVAAIAHRYADCRSEKSVRSVVSRKYVVSERTISKGIALGKQWAREYDRIHGK